MVVYIEYALIENFLLDGLLLYLAVFTAKNTVKFGRLALSAAVGAVGALAVPLLPVAAFWAYPYLKTCPTLPLQHRAQMINMLQTTTGYHL